MAPEEKRPLKAFLCHASGDKPPVRELYKRLVAEGVDAWLDKEKLLPGQDWQVEIPRAVHEADVVVVCLSNKSITKEGYVQKEIKFALDIAEEKPEGTIFLIPARLEDCPVPERLSRWQWVDLYEENGFIQLLRSLKLRASAIGAVIEAVAYEDTDKERGRRLNQLYTEGLEAFYTEDWDRACRRFQAILSEQPNHKNAAEKFEEAQCQGHYAKLYTQATEAYRSENWAVAIPALEELTQKAPNYKDAVQLLRDARKREQLAELYQEAKTLHAAQKWQAVVKVFEQISIIEPNYPDADGLLASAQKEVAELKRLSDLNEQYSHALREMESMNWNEARRLLENVHKSQIGFQETEKLLRKVEDEILKEEEKRQQNEQIDILYEQAHGLLRSGKWRNALEKLEEIRELDEHFLDQDGIAEKAQRELQDEEQEAERQNKLAALYAQSVRLLKEEKYQEALDTWQEVKAIDPKYPDRQWVQTTARRKLSGVRKTATVQNDLKTKLGRVFEPEGIKPSEEIESSIEHQPWTGWVILFAAVGFGLARLLQQNLGPIFRVVIPLEIGWILRGFICGVITALVLARVAREWKWKSILVFGISWAIVYLLIIMFVLNQRALLLTSFVFSLAPVLSISLSSLWTSQKWKWHTYLLVFIGWIVAWTIGQSVAGYLDPVFHGASTRWAISDSLAGGIGLWITTDLLKKRLIERRLDTDSASTPGLARLLLLAFISIIIIRAIWGVFQNWFHIWDAGLPTILPFTFQFVLGGCYGVVLAFSLKKVIPGWDWRHSIIVISGWALAFGTAVLWGRIGLDYMAGVMALCGLSVTGAVKWAKPSVSPLKTILIFWCWALTWMYGSMLGAYLVEISGNDYAHCFSDALIILLGLLVTYGIYAQTSGRLTRWTFLSIPGFFAMLIGIMIVAGPAVSDHFGNVLYNGRYDGLLWKKDWSSPGTIAKQQNGSMVFISKGYDSNIFLQPIKYSNQMLTRPTYIEASFRLESGQNGGAGIFVSVDGTDDFVLCQIWAINGSQAMHCQALNFDLPIREITSRDIVPGTWHTARIEVNPGIPKFTFFVDEMYSGGYFPLPPENYRTAPYTFRFGSGCAGDGCNDRSSTRVVQGYFDYVKIGPIP